MDTKEEGVEMKCKYYQINCNNPASGNLCDCYEDCILYYKQGLKNKDKEITFLANARDKGFREGYDEGFEVGRRVGIEDTGS